jgi:hypothetical protein
MEFLRLLINGIFGIDNKGWKTVKIFKIAEFVMFIFVVGIFCFVVFYVINFWNFVIQSVSFCQNGRDSFVSVNHQIFLVV